MSQLVFHKDRAGGDAVVQVSTAGASHITDAIYLQGYSQANFAISGTGAQSAALTVDTISGAAIYDVWSDVDCYIKVATTANNVTTATGYLLRAGNTVAIIVPTLSKIGAITSGAAGTLSYHRVA
jgi:hypothetical protein